MKICDEIGLVNKEIIAVCKKLLVYRARAPFGFELRVFESLHKNISHTMKVNDIGTQLTTHQT